MRIAIDARELGGRPTGVGRLLTSTLDQWGDLPAAAPHEFVLCAPGPLSVPALQRLRNSTIAISHGGSGTWWEQIQLPRLVRDAGADVLFAPAYTGPFLCPVPMVVAIHDASFAAHPEWFGWREGWRRRTLARLSALRAASIVTISDFSKREIIERLGADARKVEVIYPGVSVLSDCNSPPRQPGPGGLVLYAGSLFTRRHVPELIEGFARLARERANLQLEIVGDNRTTPRVDFAELVASTGAGDRISVRSYLPEEQLASLYRRARAFVFLSEYEGFGLTPLEALACGVPIVVLDTPVAREIYGSAALYVPKPDPHLVHAALNSVLFDEAERKRILDAAAATLSRYSWRTFAERILNVLTHAADA